MLFGLFGLSLLSICLWTGYEFLHLARMKQNQKMAGAFCASMKPGLPMADAVALANANKGNSRIDLSGDDMHVHFGQQCHCRVSFSEEKVALQKSGCSR